MQVQWNCAVWAFSSILRCQEQDSGEDSAVEHGLGIHTAEAKRQGDGQDQRESLIGWPWGLAWERRQMNIGTSEQSRGRSGDSSLQRRYRASSALAWVGGRWGESLRPRHFHDLMSQRLSSWAMKGLHCGQLGGCWWKRGCRWRPVKSGL